MAFDYTWTGLGRFCVAAVDALGLERFHLVVHDIGGPVGFELAAALPQRIASLTVLNTVVDVDGFRRPWSMEPFAHRGAGDLYLRTLTKPMFRTLMRLQGVGDMSAISQAELDAYVDLLRTGDGGRAFLKIMRGYERTAEKQTLYRSVLADDRYPVDVLWGADDPALKASVHGESSPTRRRPRPAGDRPRQSTSFEDQAARTGNAAARHELARRRVPDMGAPQTSCQPAPPPESLDRSSAARRYLIESYTLNSGRYIEITMNPTMPPTATSISGSRIEVSDLTAASTWSS